MTVDRWHGTLDNSHVATKRVERLQIYVVCCLELSIGINLNFKQRSSILNMAQYDKVKGELAAEEYLIWC